MSSDAGQLALLVVVVATDGIVFSILAKGLSNER